MGDWSALKKCCYCISLTIGTKAIASFFLLLTLGLFSLYLVKLEEVRAYVLYDMYGISPCTVAPVDTIIDSCFEYSILVNLLLLCALKKWSRWLLVPWLVMYSFNIIILLTIAILIFLNPPPLKTEFNNQLLRLLGLIPAGLSAMMLYCWQVVRSHFIKLGKMEKNPGDPCCQIKIKTGVQIIGGVLAILSGVLLVVFFAKLDELVSRQYYALFQTEISRGSLTLMAGCIVLSILVNIMLILGGTGSKWRRTLTIPWLVLYGAGIIIALATHLYFTSQCWREEKFIGLLCLCLGFLFIILWTLVWLVAAQVTEKRRTMISVPSNTAFQRL